MGCKPSKQPLCRNCNAQCSPVRRSYSSHQNPSPGRMSYSSQTKCSPVRRRSYSSHPRDENNDHHISNSLQTKCSPVRRRSYSSHPRDENNDHHVVALTSTTLGYLLLEPHPAVAASVLQQPIHRGSSESDQVRVVEAHTWSKLFNEKITKNIIIPKTPIVTPPGEPETINAWELMEGLDDSSPKINIEPLTNGEKDVMSCTKEKLVLYFTSLRGVRKTYEDCCDVRAILKNSGARIDERDVSMHSGFKEELKELLGDRYGGGLPKVFVGRKYIGGVDEIRRLHDEFQLVKVLEGCEMAADGGGGGDEGGGCEACWDIRFLPCEKCSGSCKIYYEVNCDKVKSEIEESDYGFQRCPDCNENGLIRCPICCD